MPADKFSGKDILAQLLRIATLNAKRLARSLITPIQISFENEFLSYEQSSFLSYLPAIAFSDYFATAPQMPEPLRTLFSSRLSASAGSLITGSTAYTKTYL